MESVRNLLIVDLCEHGLYNLFVLLWLERARRVQQTAARAQALERCGKNLSLSCGLAFEFRRLQTVPNLRIARQRSGAAARHVAEDQIEVALAGGQSHCIRLQRANLVVRQFVFQPPAHRLQTFRADVSRQQIYSGMPSRKDGRLSSGRGACVPDAFG